MFGIVEYLLLVVNILSANLPESSTTRGCVPELNDLGHIVLHVSVPDLSVATDARYSVLQYVKYCCVLFIVLVHCCVTETLVSLITVEAQSYGPNSLIGIKVVEYCPPPHLTGGVAEGMPGAVGPPVGQQQGQPAQGQPPGQGQVQTSLQKSKSSLCLICRAKLCKFVLTDNHTLHSFKHYDSHKFS